MSALLQQVLSYKPSFLPTWFYYALLLTLMVAFTAVAVLGFWFASTQIEFM